MSSTNEQEFQRRYDEVLKIVMSEIKTNKTIMCDESTHMEIAKMMQEAIRKITSHIYHNIDDFYWGSHTLDTREFSWRQFCAREYPTMQKGYKV